MATKYTEEIETHVTIHHDGSKGVRTDTVTYKSGVEVGRQMHRAVIARDADVPVKIAAHIEARKGKQE
jgi:hypothetical protein